MRAMVCGSLLLITLAGHADAVERASGLDDLKGFEPSATTSEGAPFWDARRQQAKALAQTSHLPYAGYWAANLPACLNPDSDERMAIEAHTIEWYETRCEIGTIASEGHHVWTLDLTCRGEGQRINARARVWLRTADALIMDNGPIGPARRQRYLRCKPH